MNRFQRCHLSILVLMSLFILSLGVGCQKTSKSNQVQQAPGNENSATKNGIASSKTSEKAGSSVQEPEVGWQPDKSDPEWRLKLKAPKLMEFKPSNTYRAKINTDLGSITVRFFPDVAPKHVTSFLFLAKMGFFDGTPFHRVAKGFVIQGGDPLGNGRGGPGYNVPAEFNKRPHSRGVLSMARSRDPNSAGSQFFITVAPANRLDGQYTVFGEVTGGMETVDSIVGLAGDDPPGRPYDGPPTKRVEIKSVEVL